MIMDNMLNTYYNKTIFVIIGICTMISFGLLFWQHVNAPLLDIHIPQYVLDAHKDELFSVKSVYTDKFVYTLSMLTAGVMAFLVGMFLTEPEAEILEDARLFLVVAIFVPVFIAIFVFFDSSDKFVKAPLDVALAHPYSNETLLSNPDIDPLKEKNSKFGLDDYIIAQKALAGFRFENDEIIQNPYNRYKDALNYAYHLDDSQKDLDVIRRLENALHNQGRVSQNSLREEPPRLITNKIYVLIGVVWLLGIISVMLANRRYDVIRELIDKLNEGKSNEKFKQVHRPNSGLRGKIKTR